MRRGSGQVLDRELLLDDVDLGNRRLTIDGRTRPIDEFSHQILLDWLDYRRARWPNTANPHLLIDCDVRLLRPARKGEAEGPERVCSSRYGRPSSRSTRPSKASLTWSVTAAVRMAESSSVCWRGYSR